MLELALRPWIGSEFAYTIHLPAITLCAVGFGVQPAMTAIGSAFVAATMLHGTPIHEPEPLAALVLFGGVSLGIVYVTQRLISWRDQALSSQREAARQVQELALLVDAASHHAIFFLDPDRRVALWSPSAARIWGWTGEEVVGHPVTMFRGDDAEPPPVTDPYEEAIRSGRARLRATRVRKDGSTFIADITLTPLYGNDGTLRGYGKVVADVTEEAEASARLELRERQLSSILATVPEATIIMDAAGRITSVNEATTTLFGYSTDCLDTCAAGLLFEALPRRWSAVTDTLPLDQMAASGPFEATARRADGATFPVAVAIGAGRACGERFFTMFVRDMSREVRTRRELHQVQARLLHLSRISAMATMAATLAHELNQPLGAIENYVAAARRMVGEAESPHSALTTALDGASAQSLRAGLIIKRTRMMLARGESEFCAVDIADAIREAAELALAGMRPGDVCLHLLLGNDPDMVWGDRVQIQQVIINLLRNAVEAVSGRPDRRIVIETNPGHAQLAITVRDAGPGLDEDARRQAFSAFHGTKPSGLGVGLSICRTIVEAHRGRIWIDDSEQGASITFSLPRPEQL